MRELGRVSYIDWIENLNIKTEMLMNEKLPDEVKEFSVENCPNGNLAKVAKFHTNSYKFWPVYPIHTNSLFWVIFVELPFCHFPPPNTSIRGKDSKIQLIFHLSILVFQTNGKQPYSFPVLSHFCNGLFSQGGPFSNEADIQRGPGLKRNTKYHDNLKLKIKIKKHMVYI